MTHPSPEHADLMIDFCHRICCRRASEGYELWLDDGAESPSRVFSADSLRKLIDDRCTVISLPIHLCRDGRDVVIGLSDRPDFEDEWSRCRSERFRDLLVRAARLARR